jgi:chorismate dehydratase
VTVDSPGADEGAPHIMPIRLGAVSYLNTRPLVYGLEGATGRFTVRFDVPARCAALLHANDVDLGLIPSIEYIGHDYRIVPDVSIASDGPVASVAIFSRTPIQKVRSIALDTSSRTSQVLLRVLCARRFEISPELVNMPPELPQMLDRCDAALVIGDNALFTDHEALGLDKIDLGEEWTGMTGLPFVYAFWAGRPGIATSADIAALQEARDAGVRATATIGRQAYPDSPGKAARADRYLREDVKYALGERERQALRRFYELAAEVGVVPAAAEPRFFEAPASSGP